MGVGQRACDATQRGAFPLRAALGPSSNTSLTYAPPRQEVNRPAGQTGKFTGKVMVSCIYNIAEVAVEPPALHYTPRDCLSSRALQPCEAAFFRCLLSAWAHAGATPSPTFAQRGTHTSHMLPACMHRRICADVARSQLLLQSGHTARPRDAP